MKNHYHRPRAFRSVHVSVLCLILLIVGKAPAQEVRVVVSSKAGDRLAAKPPLRFEVKRPDQGAGFQIDEGARFQKIAGFGATFLEAGMICINSLPAEAQARVFESLFDPVKGAGFSAMKTPLAGTDFMSAGPWYTYNDHPGDTNMSQFSIQRDLARDGVLTFIQRARKYGSFVLQAPMDYPPDWMLYDVNKNQDVDPRYYDALALYYLRYLQEYEKHGVLIDYLSLFNEPGIYTKIPYDKIRDLLKNHVGPLFKKEALRTRLMLSEAQNRNVASQSYPTVMDDPAARQYVAVMPYHGYDLKQFDQLAKLRERYPEVPLWMTEICHAYEAGTPKTMPLPRLDFEDGDFWGRQIFGDLAAGAAAWIYWNLILDQKGGPWLVSPIHGNPDPNIQHPVVVIDRETHQVTYTGGYYYLTHFSKFVRPGSVRIQANGAVEGIQCVAFETPGGGRVAELMNSGPTEAGVQLGWRKRTLGLKLPPVSITTCVWDAGR